MKNRRWNRRFHRWSGLILIIPLSIACITGVLLNHSVDLGLKARHVTSPLILRPYGMTLKGEPIAYGMDGRTYAASWDGSLFHASRLIDSDSTLIGAVPLRDGFAIVTRQTIHYYGLDGELIEKLNPPEIPKPFEKAGRSSSLSLVLRSGDQFFISDPDLLGFTKTTTPPDVQWSEPVTPTLSEKSAWKTAFRGEGLPLDRVILDIHSGRILGPVGKWLWDIAAIGVLALSISGLILFFKNRKRNR
ncbi:PepSY domain-containing protein [Luteolibacter algae]|uniref:PepSY domain-containing protein n=1 Tax=Luteolibacter algae TaxID=454151 RepID=A0ABW5D5S0_9BACT